MRELLECMRVPGEANPERFSPTHHTSLSLATDHFTITSLLLPLIVTKPRDQLKIFDNSVALLYSRYPIVTKKKRSHLFLSANCSEILFSKKNSVTLDDDFSGSQFIGGMSKKIRN